MEPKIRNVEHNGVDLVQVYIVDTPEHREPEEIEDQQQESDERFYDV